MSFSAGIPIIMRRSDLFLDKLSMKVLRHILIPQKLNEIFILNIYFTDFRERKGER